MEDRERLINIYRNAIASLCRENGGVLEVDLPSEELVDMPFSIWFEVEDGKMRFILDEDVGTKH